MGLCETLEKALGYRVGIYDEKGKHLKGTDLGYKYTRDILWENSLTYIRSGSLIICVEGKVSRDSCALIRLLCQQAGEEHEHMQSLEYILKNDVSKDSIRGKYAGYTVMYIKTPKDIKDFIERLYEDVSIEMVEDENGLYLLIPSEDDEQEGDSIINGLMEEKGVSVLIGSGRKIGGSYTVKDSAEHARAALNLAFGLGYKSGFFHIDMMTIYGLINSIPENEEKFYLNGGYGGFSQVNSDKELINTAEKLLSCNLNISEAARNLYIHRNTLLYRLEKIKNLTGLDIKRFDDAFIFRTIIIIYKLKGSL